MKLPSWWSALFIDLRVLSNALRRVDATDALSTHLEEIVPRAYARAEMVRKDLGSGRRYREIALPDLPIVVPVARQLHPCRADVADAKLTIVYSCYDKIEQKQSFGSADLDRIRRADVQVKISGLAQFGDILVELEDHWRVDTHFFIGEPNEPHPLFHFQRGGHAQDAFAGIHGFLPGDCLDGSVFASEVQLCALMQTAAPRIALPPMDPICAIDFVMGQHNGSIRSALWAVPEYAAIVRRAQERLWKPYLSSCKTVGIARGSCHLSERRGRVAAN